MEQKQAYGSKNPESKNPEGKNPETGNPASSNPEAFPVGFTRALALVDAVPVLLFCADIVLISVYFRQPLFVAGAILCALAGCGKVAWKLLLAYAHTHVPVLNKQFRYVMPCGFLLMVAGLVIGRASIDAGSLWSAVMSSHASIFFVLGICGMVSLSVCARKLNGMSARTNWIEQALNIVMQACFLAGIICVAGQL